MLELTFPNYYNGFAQPRDCNVCPLFGATLFRPRNVKEIFEILRYSLVANFEIRTKSGAGTAYPEMSSEPKLALCLSQT